MVNVKKLLMVVLSIGLFASHITETRADDTNPNGRSSSLTGRYLVASPDMHDPNFRHTVIYLVHHDAFGAMGVVINRLMAKGPVGRLLDAFGIEGNPGVIESNPGAIEGSPSEDAQVKMHYGGPVEPESSLVLHRNDYRNGTTTDIGNHLAVSSSDDVLADLAMGKGPGDSLLILGYAGWASEQLENEITAGAWFVVDSDDALLFDDDIATKWQRALSLRGFEL
ncbi:MAG: YqgE/AlgH family protein [Geminicoccaceae bacterium]